ncbi:unnamed protein product [Ilex paraguariensis]|uniref:Pectinesterase n=1 Tax=Ilex paraguariensis TaxID=185542 RepID=A0ABC8SWK2_9AQUA
MEPTNPTAIKNSSQPSKNLTRNRATTIILSAFLTVTALLLASLLSDDSSFSTDSTRDNHPLIPSSAPPLHPIIKKSCTNTLHPSLCFITLSTIPDSNNATTFHQILEIAINQTMKQVVSTRLDILNNLPSQDFGSLEKNALDDCVEMLDQTIYELGQAIDDLRALPSSVGYLHRSYGNTETLLSAAMTNENTCIDGFSDLEESDSKGLKGVKEPLQNLLTPISHRISNCLAMIKYMDTIHREETLNNPRILMNKLPDDRFLAWMTSNDRRMMETEPRMRPNLTVARDGSGNYTMINEAVKMAPNMSLTRYVIQIKAGIYHENVVIPREKVNIMLVGDGTNSTVITGFKNFVDGFSTFTSATLTVVGDKFLARDLSIFNTAGPQKHQAVALRVTSNAAFYRCQIISHQDTLYAHSLRQFYRECEIQGTIDFIFGNAAAIFQNCFILVRKPNPGQKNMITAQGREDPNQNTGISLQNCTIIAAPDFDEADRINFSTFLGRPWRNYSRTIIMNSYLGDLIHPQGWYKWNNYSSLDTVEYIEYMNSGPGSDTRQRVTWAGYRKNCTEEIARQFTVGTFLHGADDWLDSTVFPLFGGPQQEARHIQ